MNINFGLQEPMPRKKMKKKERNILYVDRALTALREWISSHNLDLS